MKQITDETFFNNLRRNHMLIKKFTDEKKVADEEIYWWIDLLMKIADAEIYWWLNLLIEEVAYEEITDGINLLMKKSLIKKFTDQSVHTMSWCLPQPGGSWTRSWT